MRYGLHCTLESHTQTYMLSSPTEAAVFPWALNHPGVGGSNRVGGRSEGGMREGVSLAHILQGSEVNIPHWPPTKIVQSSYVYISSER